MGDAERLVVSSKEPECDCWPCWFKRNRCNGEGSSSFPPEQFRELQVQSYLETFPVGLVFQPSDEEAVLYFLTKKNNNEQLPPNPIKDQVDMYKSTPEDLLDKYRKYMTRGKELYIFTKRTKKYDNGLRPSRSTTGSYVGFWKIVGGSFPIHNADGKKVGVKHTVNFYKGTSEGKPSKTPFTMLEYILEAENIDSESSQDDCKKQKQKQKQKLKPVTLALCKIWEKTKKVSDKTKKTSSPIPEPPSENTDIALLSHANAENDSSEPVMGSPIQEPPLENTDIALLGHANAENDSSEPVMGSPIQEPPLENTDTALLGHANAKNDSLEPVMGSYQVSSSINMDMAVDNGNFLCTTGLFQGYSLDDTTNQYGDMMDFQGTCDMGVYQDTQYGSPGYFAAAVLGHTNTEFNPSGSAMGAYQGSFSVNVDSDANTENESLDPVMGAYQGSSSIDMDMAVDNGNLSYTGGFLQEYSIDDTTNQYGDKLDFQDTSFEQQYGDSGYLDTVLGHTSTEFNSSGPDMGVYHGSMQEHMAMRTFEDPFMGYGDNYWSGEKENGVSQVPLNQENQFKSSDMSNYLSGLDISGSSSYDFDEHDKRIADNQLINNYTPNGGPKNPKV